MAQGLRARGLDAYWVRAAIPGKGTHYRVRIGKFPGRSSARNYAERLRQSGLLDNYFIFAYEPPSSVKASPSLAPPSPSAPPPPPPASRLSQSERAAIVLVASRRWAVPAPASVIAPGSHLPLPTLASASQLLIKMALPPPPAWRPQVAGTTLPPPPRVAASVMSPPNSNPAPPRPTPQLANVVNERVSPAPALERAAPNLPPPLLQGTIRNNNGQLQMTLQNLDGQRSFTGLARVSVGDGEKQSEAAPVPVSLGPNEERSFTVSPTLVKGGSYMMIVYDAAGAVRLIRGASLTPGTAPKPAVTEAAVSAPPANEITVVPRQIAATSENITVEFEITSQRPLGYVSLTLRAANLTDVKRAVLTTAQARIPFLVPVRGVETVFSYELKDDSDRVLVSGEDDFRRLAAGNGP